MSRSKILILRKPICFLSNLLLVQVIGDGAFFSQLMQMKDGYTDGHSGEWFTSPEDMEKTMAEYWAEGFQIHVRIVRAES